MWASAPRCPHPQARAPRPPWVPRTQQHGLGSALAQDGLEDAQQRLGELLLQVVLRVDGQAVLQHEQGVLWAQRPAGSHSGSGVTGTRSHWLRRPPVMNGDRGTAAAGHGWGRVRIRGSERRENKDRETGQRLRGHSEAAPHGA